jgi:dihydrofolate reductase
MSAPFISLVVAATQNDVIGRDNGMPWHLPDDLRYFKARTMGKPMLMGRKTFEAIGKPLPGRTSIVLTRDAACRGCGRRKFPDEALPRRCPELCVVGGAEVFRLAMPLAKRLLLTRIHADIPGDTFFPKVNPDEWREIERVEHPADERHAHAMSFITLDRVG